MPKIVRFVLVKLKPGVTPEAYERFEREVEYPTVKARATVVSHRVHRITDVRGPVSGGPWDFVERIEVTDRAAYERELASSPDTRRLVDAVYGTYLQREGTASFWTELVE